jgi:CrcB protein
LTALAVAVGGALGAIARYAVDGVVARRQRGLLPQGTLLVNVTGSLLLGALVGGDAGGAAYALLGIGFLGAFTTFSTFAYETVQLLGAGAWRLGLVNIALGFGLAVPAAALGYRLVG